MGSRSLLLALLIVALTLCAGPAAQANIPPAAGGTTVQASDVTSSTATLNAVVYPYGLPTTAHFEYGLRSSALTFSTPETAVGAGVDPVPFSATVGELAPNDQYYVRVVATNSAGVEYGDILNFKTWRLAQLLSPRSSDEQETTATLRVNVRTYGTPTTVTFTYWPVGGAQTAVVQPASDGYVAVPISGLQPGTEYQWQAVASNPGGSSNPVGGGFKTKPALVIASSIPTASPRNVVYGQRSTLTGSATPGTSVALHQLAFPFRGQFALATQTFAKAGASGRISFSVQPSASTMYALSLPGVTPAKNAAVRVDVSAAVTNVSVRKSKRRKGRYTVAGRYRPAGNATAVLANVGSGARVGQPISVRGGKFKIANRKLRPGRYEVQIVVDRSGIDTGQSRTLRIRRR